MNGTMRMALGSGLSHPGSSVRRESNKAIRRKQKEKGRGSKWTWTARGQLMGSG